MSSCAGKPLLATLVALACGSALAQQPRIDSVTPSQGPIAGGTIITVRGANLAGVSIAVDRVAAVPLSRGDAELRLQMPRHDNGYAVISARNSTGAAYGEFLYLAPRLQDLPPGFITTVAGVGTFRRDYGPATRATLSPWALKFDSAGNLYVPDTGANRVYRIGPDGMIERIAGTGEPSPLGDGGPALDALLTQPRDVALDDRGNLYIGSDQCRLRRIGTDGIINTIAGDGVCGFAGDGGPAAASRIGQPTYVVADASDLFFIDWNAMRIRRIHFADGTISTVAGNGVAGFSGDGGPAWQASFNLPNNDEGALALDPAGNLYLADGGNQRVRRIDRGTGIITTFFLAPGVRSLASDRAGNIYIGGSGTIIEVDPSGKRIAGWGNGRYELPVDGVSASTAGLGHVLGIAIDGGGNIVYSDDAIGRVRRINIATGLLETVAGIGPALVGENGPATGAVILPLALAFDRDGTLLIAETLRLRRLDRSGNLLTIGGTGSFVGKPAPARMNEVVIAPTAVTLDRDGNVEMCDLSVIDRIDSSGTLRIIAGRSAVCDYSGDGGPATDAALCQAWDITHDAQGNLFIADTNNNRVRRIDAATGVITTVVGKGGPTSGHEGYNHGTFCGDGGPAIDACINTPYGLAFDAAGNLFIAEGPGIRRVDTAGRISTFVGGTHVSKLVFDRAGYLYAGRFSALERFDARAQRRIIAGTDGQPGFAGDGGPATAAKVALTGQAAGIAIDTEGNVFFCESNRIRAVRYGAVLAPPDARISLTANGSVLRANVFDETGAPIPGVRVEFGAPASGATCFLSTSFAMTDGSGVAAVSCTPSCTAGTYSIAAMPLGGPASASVTLTNPAGPCRRRSVRH